MDRPAKGQGGKMRVLLVAVKKDIIQERLKLLDSVGLEADIIDVDSFALILMRQDHNSEEILKRALSLVDPQFSALPVNDNEAFVFLANTDRDQAQQWAAGFRQQIKKELMVTVRSMKFLVVYVTQLMKFRMKLINMKYQF